MPVALVKIGSRVIGAGQKPYIIAEMSGNHNGDLSRALAIMEAAKKAGADAVKLQTYTPGTMTIDCERPEFQITGGPWAGHSLYDLYRGAHTPWDWHEALFAKGRELEITVFSTPFDKTAVDFLEGLDCPAYKIASFENADLELISHAAATGKPLIISTGMADHDEIAEAVETARDGGCGELALLHCVSAYPTPAQQSHLLTIPSYADEFHLPIGLSDHSLGTAVAVASISLGATMVEKHFTLSRADGGSDAAFSLEPDEFAALCRDCVTAWQALGSVNGASPDAEASRIFRRSLYVVADVVAGDALSEVNVRSIRPGWGLAPKHLPELRGRIFIHDVPRGTALDWSMLES